LIHNRIIFFLFGIFSIFIGAELSSIKLWAGERLAAERPLSFEKMLEEMTNQHAAVLVEKEKVNQAQITLRKRKLNLLPHLSLDASQTGNGFTNPSSNSVSLDGNINLFRSGADSALIDAASFDLDGERSQLSNIKITSETESAQVLIHYIEKQRKIEILKNSAQTFQTAREIADQRYRKGLLPLQEADKAVVDLNNAQARLSDAQLELILARENFERLSTGQEVETLWPWKITMEKSHFRTPMKNDFYQRSLNERPDYRALLSQVNAEHARSISSHRTVFPALNLSASYGAVENLGAPWTLGNATTISISMPFFEAFQNQSDYELQRASESIAMVKLKQLERDIRAQVNSAQDTFITSIETAQAREQTLLTSRKLYETNLRRLQQGRATANDVALDQSRLTDSELLALQGWSGAHLSFVNLCHSVGLLVGDCR
jgi:outer membrane protein TolC